MYAAQQMKDIKSGARSNGMTAAMKGVMHLVSDEEIDAIAHGCRRLDLTTGLPPVTGGGLTTIKAAASAWTNIQHARTDILSGASPRIFRGVQETIFHQRFAVIQPPWLPPDFRPGLRMERGGGTG